MKKKQKESPTLHPIHVAEIIWLYEMAALTAERSGRENSVTVAECIREQIPGMLEAIAKTEAEQPGYADTCIRAMAAAVGVQLPN